jgi:hypothetical protein
LFAQWRLPNADASLSISREQEHVFTQNCANVWIYLRGSHWRDMIPCRGNGNPSLYRHAGRALGHIRLNKAAWHWRLSMVVRNCSCAGTWTTPRLKLRYTNPYTIFVCFAWKFSAIQTYFPYTSSPDRGPLASVFAPFMMLQSLTGYSRKRKQYVTQHQTLSHWTQGPNFETGNNFWVGVLSSELLETQMLLLPPSRRTHFWPANTTAIMQITGCLVKSRICLTFDWPIRAHCLKHVRCASSSLKERVNLAW